MKKKNIIILVVSIAVVLLLVMGVIFIGIPVYLNYTAKKALTDTLSTNSETAETQIESLESLESQLEEQEKKAFNASFIAYETEEDETTTYANVSALFSMIASSNASFTDRLIDVNGTVITNENVASLKEILTSDTKYKIKCILDDNGYVKTIELKYVNEE